MIQLNTVRNVEKKELPPRWAYKKHSFPNGHVDHGDYVTVTCRHCDNRIDIDKTRYFKNTHGKKWTCEDCKRKFRLEASAKAAKQVKSLSPEDYAKYCNTRKKNTKKWWNELTPEEQAVHIEKTRRGINSFYENHDPEFHQMLSARTKLSWDNLSPIEYLRRCQHMKNAWNNKSDEDKKMSLQKLWDGSKKWWKSMTPEEYKKWKLNWITSYQKYLNNIDEKPNKNERDFISAISKWSIIYEWQHYNSTAHPEFAKKFPVNPYTKSELILPYHKWDFIIHTKITDFLVDVDGSIHNYDKTDFMVTTESGVRFKLNEFIKFRDSQRPYQTDGLPAYAVLCYDDKITMKTPVKDLVNNTTIPFSMLLSILRNHDETIEEV